MSRLPLGEIAPGQIARSNGVQLEGLTIGEGLFVEGRVLKSKATGTSGVGPPGPKGDKGDPGDDGSPGADGAAFANIDGGDADDTFGGTTGFDGGVA